jgi:hypothetical protein
MQRSPGQNGQIPYKNSITEIYQPAPVTFPHLPDCPWIPKRAIAAYSDLVDHPGLGERGSKLPFDVRGTPDEKDGLLQPTPKVDGIDVQFEVTVAMPSGLSLPLAFGMNIRLIGSGRYLSCLSASASSVSHRCTPYASMSAKS